MDITNISIASMRHHTGLRGTEEMATAALIDANLKKDNALPIIDHKVKRAQERLAVESGNKFDKNLDNV